MRPTIRLAMILPFLAGIFSCSSTGKINCEGNFYYTDDFTPEQKSWIEESSVRWNAWAGRSVTSVRPGVGPDYSCTIYVGKTKKDSAIGEIETRLQSIVVDLDDLTKSGQKALDKDQFEGVVMHEIGHALGYSHIRNGEALMAPAGTVDFTELDRLECIKRGMCLTLLTDEQVAQQIENQKEKEEDETQPSDRDRKGNEGSLGPGAYESPPRPSQAGIAGWHCPRLYPH